MRHELRMSGCMTDPLQRLPLEVSLWGINRGVSRLLTILLKKHIFRMLCWMPVGNLIIMPGIDESTEV